MIATILNSILDEHRLPARLSPPALHEECWLLASLADAQHMYAGMTLARPSHKHV
jgi:hypothetical protein